MQAAEFLDVRIWVKRVRVHLDHMRGDGCNLQELQHGAPPHSQPLPTFFMDDVMAGGVTPV
jgi:hypothetical protein